MPWTIEKLFIIPRTIRLLAAYILILIIGAEVFVKLEEPAGKEQTYKIKINFHYSL